MVEHKRLLALMRPWAPPPPRRNPGMVQPVIPATWEVEAADQEFKIILGLCNKFVASLGYVKTLPPNRQRNKHFNPVN